MRLWWVVGPVLAAAGAAGAAERPPARCRESTIVERLPGCAIRECRERDFDEAELQAGPLDGTGEFPRQLVEGRTLAVTYACPANFSLEGIADRARAALKRQGFAIVYSGEMYYNDLPGFTMRKGRQWIQVVSEPFGEENGYTLIEVEAVEPASPTSGRRVRKTERN